jgi:hypothetical protein
MVQELSRSIDLVCICISSLHARRFCKFPCLDRVPRSTSFLYVLRTLEPEVVVSLFNISSPWSAAEANPMDVASVF